MLVKNLTINDKRLTLKLSGGSDGTRTRDLLRDREAL